MSEAAEYRRPAAHFHADTWINDPNGLVYAAGAFHLFYQNNPNGAEWGHLSWGHAVSQDLVEWTCQPTAIEATDAEYVFSGSAAVDHRNTTGLGKGGQAPVLAAYTGVEIRQSERFKNQAQCLAYSVDGGATWERSQRNPVLDLDSQNTRDPKVFWYGGDDGHWVMIIVDAIARRVLLFTSPDLHEWTAASSFEHLRDSDGIWECPDLFPLVDETTGRERWVLIVSMNPGGPAGGSGTQYFVGDFDGVTFVADPQHYGEGASSQWLDYGPDCYAGVTFNDVPDGRRLLVAWADNWNYARHLVLQDRQSSMTLVRELTLTRASDGLLRLRQVPVLPAEGSAIASEIGVHSVTAPATAGSRSVVHVGSELEIEVTDGVLTCHRNLSHLRDVPEDYSETISAPLLSRPETELTVIVDHGIVEVFTDNGLTALAVRTFPAADAGLPELRVAAE